MSHRHYITLASGQKIFVLVAPSYQGNGPLCFVAHGFFADANYYSTLVRRQDLEVLASSGFVVVTADFGGASTWANDTFLNSVAEVVTYATTFWDADASSISWIGDSMGGMNALNYAWRNASTRGAYVLRVPVLNADAVHDRDPGGLGAAIDGAYGSGANWDSAKATRDPALNHTLIDDFGQSIRVYYSNNDTVNLLSEVSTFVDATGASAISLGSVAHDENLIYPQVNGKSQAAWMWDVIN